MKKPRPRINTPRGWRKAPMASIATGAAAIDAAEADGSLGPGVYDQCLDGFGKILAAQGTVRIILQQKSSPEVDTWP
jgi:hypothetical protein